MLSFRDVTETREMEMELTGEGASVAGAAAGETVNMGIKSSLKLWSRWEARATFQPPILSPDSLGLKGGDSFQLGLRYRWAAD